MMIFFNCLKKFSLGLLFISVLATWTIAQTAEYNYQFRPNTWMKNNTLQVATSNETNRLQQTIALPAVTESINFNPVRVFEEQLPFFSLPFELTNLSSFTTIVVYQPITAEKEQVIWSTNNGLKSKMLTTHRVSNAKNGWLTFSDEVKNIPVINTSIQYFNKNAFNLEKPEFTLGKSNAQKEDLAAFEGKIAEFIVFNRSINPKEQLVIESYLALKYGITLPSSDYRNAKGELLWSNEKNIEFSNHIAGIGRDDVMQLLQKQSTSTAESHSIIIGAGQLQSSNTDNTYPLNEGDFLIWGNNNAAPAWEEVESEKPNNCTFLQRKWLMTTTGQTANSIPTSIQWDVSDLNIPTNHQISLVIDRNGQNEFSDNSTFILSSERTDTDLITFQNVQWDIDGSGNDHFTFAISPIYPVITEFFEVSPNPSQGAITIAVELQQAADVEVNIFDIQGRKLQETLKGKKQNVYSFQSQINSPGVYLVELKTENEKWSKEIIISQ